MPATEVEGLERLSAPGAMFLLKADIDLPDGRLRALRADSSTDEPPDGECVARAIEALAARGVQRTGTASRGTFRWVVPAVLETGEAVVLRLNRLEHPALAAGLRREYELTGVLRAEGLPVPGVVALDADGDRCPGPAALMSAADGHTLGELDQTGDEAGVLAGLEALGAVLRRLHELRGEGAGPLGLPIRSAAGRHLRGEYESWSEYLSVRLDDHLAACVEAGALSPPEATRASALLADLPAPNAVDRLLHGDPGGPNIFVQGGEVSALVDWEDALIGDAVFDVASAALFHPERRWPALFRGYWGRDDVPGDDRARFWLYQLRIALARTVVRARFGLRDLPGREPAAARVRRALTAAQERVG